jgi:hypothetical protein
MKRQRLYLAAIGGIVALSLGAGAAAHAATLSGPSAGVVLTSHGGLGIWIGGGPAVLPPRPPVVHREVVVTPPWRERFVRIRPYAYREREKAETMVVPRPVLAPPGAVENGPVTVWITNSNGSRTVVTLRKQGGWYIGPRGEYYAGMPANEQLRVVYGF